MIGACSCGAGAPWGCAGSCFPRALSPEGRRAKIADFQQCRLHVKRCKQELMRAAGVQRGWSTQSA